MPYYHACHGKTPLCLYLWPTVCIDSVQVLGLPLFVFSPLSASWTGKDASYQPTDRITASLYIQTLVTHFSWYIFFFFFLQMSRIKCTSQLWGPVSQTQMTGKVLLPTPVLVSWGPALIHFCLWALARNYADKPMGCPLIGQMFFSTGACRVGKNSKLAGLTCQPIFLSLGNSVKVAKYLEFRTQVNTSFNTR